MIQRDKFFINGQWTAPSAKEMIDVLTIQYNKARQERITKELLDIVGGAEALRQAVEA